MKYNDISALEEQMSNATQKRWWIKENDTQPFYTIECTTSGFECKNNCDTDDAVRMFCKGIMYGYLLTQLERLEIDAEKERKANKRKRLNAGFNPWKFASKDKRYPVMTYAYFHDGVVAASDSHSLVEVKMEYDPQFEGKLVDDDLNICEREYRYPDYQKVFYSHDDERNHDFTLQHDAAWYTETAKQMKADAKSGVTSFCKIGNLYFKHPEVELLGYWLKYYTPQRCVWSECRGIQMWADGSTLLQMSCIVEDEESPIIYE